MIFHRRVPGRHYRDYTRYRSILREDFQYRCAFCLTHERYLGGEAGCTIDHFRPMRGKYARPDLARDYSNLYWTCRECNENKGDAWPSPEEEAEGFRFIDPCTEGDDHDNHWHTNDDGTLLAITHAGEYTIEHLLLWRGQLNYHRARMIQWQLQQDYIIELLAKKRMSPEMRFQLEARVLDLHEMLNPPAFTRPTRVQSTSVDPLTH